MVIRDVCPRCQSPKFKKNGHIHNGKQNHHCHDCGRQFVESFEQYLISDERRALIKRLLLERISLRGICRAVGVTLKWLLGEGKPMVQRVTQRTKDAELSHAQLTPLEPGDRFTRMEFERRYSAMPRCPKAELIEGAVHMPSPARFRRHAQPQAHLVWWLVHYEMGTPGVATGDNSTTRLDLDNEPQPDAVLLIDPARGGQARLSEDDYIEDAPELVAEVAASSASIDLRTKFHVYRRNGVRAYLVWRVLDQAIDWFVLHAGQYERLQPDAQGLLRSEVFPGLWPDTAARLRG